jgi:molybdopterin-guanine dinucleotide biosynthesis protein A
VALFPLHYQLDIDYPYIPQTVLKKYCTEQNIPCLDLLPALRRHTDEDLFMIERAPQYGDIWHLTEAGHRVAARSLESFLADSLQVSFEPPADVAQ